MTVFVISGSYRQAQDWARRQELPHTAWRYVRRPDDLLGLRSPHTVVWCGTWYERSDVGGLHEIIKRQELLRCETLVFPAMALTPDQLDAIRQLPRGDRSRDDAL